MKNFNEIKDDQIRVIGGKDEKKGFLKRFWFIFAVAGVLLVAATLFFCLKKSATDDPESGFFEPNSEILPQKEAWFGSPTDAKMGGFIEIFDTLMNDIPLKIYIPHNAEMSLCVGQIPEQDESIIYAAQAADVRADNGGIVGAFVLKGEPLSWGLSKKGFCAAIDGKITIGVAENSPLFEEATEKAGYFFRQFPLVKNGELVENEPKGKAIRRGICNRKGEIFMVETETRESFHDFSQALVDLGVDVAVYLVGSNTYGWATDQNGTRHEFGEKDYYKNRCPRPENVNYLVWKK